MSLVVQARILVAASAASLALLAGCSGKPIGDDLTQKVDPTTPTDAGPDVIECSAISSACNPGDQAVPQESCTAADACYALPSVCGQPPVWCAHRTVQCGAIPRCDMGDTQVSVCPPPVPGPGPGGGYECYTRSVCDWTIQCVHSDTCKALPTCNPGDIQAVDPSECLNGGVKCYSVSACGSTIQCYAPLGGL